MSGRNRSGGRGAGRGGRRHNSHPRKPNTPPNKKKSITDFYFYVGSSKQASDYENTVEFVINHIKKTFERGNDISEALRKLEKPNTDLWKPTLRVSSATDSETKDRENKQFEIEYKAELDEAMKRKRVFDDNLYKAYALIWERCAKAMQNKLQSRSDYESKIYNDPIKLLLAIKEHSLNYQETRYEMSIISDAIRAFLGTKQKEGESLQDYTRRFKTARDVMESHVGGPLILSKFVKTMKGYDPNDHDKMEQLNETAAEQLYAFVHLENADQSKYGTILRNLSQQKSLGNDQYPRSVTETTNVMSNHLFDSSATNKTGKPSENRNKMKNDDKKQEEDDAPPLSFAQLEGKCYCCGKPGHKSPDCRNKDKIPKEEWAINKAQAHTQQSTNGNISTPNESSSKSSAASSKDEAHVAWASVLVKHSFLQGYEMKDWILLDSDSTDTIFCNPRYVTNIVDSEETLELGTNGGVLVTKKKCDVPHLGQRWYNPEAIANVISLADMSSHYRVSYDSAKERAFVVHMPHKDVRFYELKSGLYAMNPLKDGNPPNSKQAIQLVNTVEENLRFMSERQRKRAKKARQLYDALGAPSLDDLKAMIRMNLIKNNEVTTADVNLALKAFGPDVAAIKGKTTRSKPVPVVDNVIEIPDELLEVNKEVELSVDGITVNSLKFFTTISHEIYYRTAQYVSSTAASIYKHCMDEILGIYRQGGFSVTDVHCDNEFRKTMDDYAPKQNPPIRMHYVAAQEHVARAERNNRTIKERVRTAYYRLPYEHLPRIMVKYLVSECARKLNFFPNKHGISKHYSPRMILHQENIDYNKHCKFAFGDYVQAHEEPQPSNTNAPRSLDCIYLRPAANSANGHELLHLQTNEVVTRRKCTPVPLTPMIIKQVHELARQDGMPKGLKIVNRTGLVLFDSASIAGVDYEEELFDDDDYSENENDDEENDEDNDDDLDSNDQYDDIDENEIADILQETPRYNHNYEHDGNEAIEHPDDDSEESNRDLEQPSESENENEQDDDVDNLDDPPTDNQQEVLEPSINIRRSKRQKKPNPRYIHLQAKTENIAEYSEETSRVIAMVMCHFNEQLAGMSDNEAYSFVQTYSLKAGLKKFGEEGRKAATKEMKQLHDRVVFKPIRPGEMTSREQRRAMESLIFLVQKRDGRIKARTCANGSVQRDYIPKEDAASPTAATESVLITGVIDAKQQRDVMTLDIPNAFVQTEIPKGKEKIIMKIRGALVDILCEIAPEVYSDYVIEEGSQKVLYVEMLKALYGMLIASLLYYKKFRKDIEEIGFEINPYDACVANMIVNGEQQTIVWHVDDVKSSHVDPKVNDEFYKWTEKTYGSDETGHVTVTRGDKHDYLGMVLDYSSKGELKVDMRQYVESMLEEFPQTVKPMQVPWTEKLFKVDKTSPKIDEERKGIFHTFVMKGMFVAKRARKDILPAIAFLASRVKDPNEGDWNKLLRVLGFLKKTKEDVLTLVADNFQSLYWMIDAAFAVHPDMKSHTGGVFTLGKGAIHADSIKQKVNSRSSTEAELIGVDDEIAKVLWTKRFIEHQGFEVKLNIIYQDNTSAMKLEKNAKGSSGKRTRHFDIKLFYVTDLIDRGEVTVIYCPTDDMIADYMTKPTTGTKFHELRDLIMNLNGNHHRVFQQECVGQ